MTAPLVLRPDPRVTTPQADLEAQLRFSLQVRDAITRLTRDVVRLQTVRRQLAQRNELLAGTQGDKTEKAKPLIDASQALVVELDDLEARIHNPKAEISYDVLAQKGGSKLYSRMAPLLGWVTSGNGAPTLWAIKRSASQIISFTVPYRSITEPRTTSFHVYGPGQFQQ